MHAGFQFVFGSFFCSDSLGPPPFHASSTFAKAWNSYAFAKADPGFLQQSQ